MLNIFEVSDAEMVFSTAAHIPKKEEIPKEFWGGHTKWNKVVSQLFFDGGKVVKITPKKGVDKTKAMRAIQSILRSFDPSHEHKEAAVAFMLSEWFDEFELSSQNTKSN